MLLDFQHQSRLVGQQPRVDDPGAIHSGVATIENNLLSLSVSICSMSCHRMRLFFLNQKTASRPSSEETTVPGIGMRMYNAIIPETAGLIKSTNLPCHCARVLAPMPTTCTNANGQAQRPIQLGANSTRPSLRAFAELRLLGLPKSIQTSKRSIAKRTRPTTIFPVIDPILTQNILFYSSKNSPCPPLAQGL